MKKRYLNLLGVFILIGLFVVILPTSAQDEEPTDRPFPGAAATTVPTDSNAAPTDRPFPGAAATTVPADSNATPTDRPFPGAGNVTSIPEGEGTVEATVETTEVVLSFDEVRATATSVALRIVELEDQVERLQGELDDAQADTGATTFALVIIVVGVLLSFSVFFGLRRSEE